MLTILTVKAISLIEFVAWLQRGGPNAWVGTTVANNNKRARRNAALNPHQTPAVTASATAPTVTASSISTSATTTGTHNDNSSISMWF